MVSTSCKALRGNLLDESSILSTSTNFHNFLLAKFWRGRGPLVNVYRATSYDNFRPMISQTFSPFLLKFSTRAGIMGP